jgi:hypothetical protein
MLTLAVAISLVGVLKFLLLLAVIVLLIVGIKYLFGLAGWVIPQPIWIVIGVIVFLLLILYFIGGSSLSIT